MIPSTTFPAHVDLDGFTRLVLSFDPADDIAVIHLDGPRPAVTEPIDDGWYVRLADGELAGLEIHGLRRVLLTSPFYSSVFLPALDELEAFSGHRLLEETEGFTVEGSTAELRKTTHWLILMIGSAAAKWESSERDEAARAFAGTR